MDDAGRVELREARFQKSLSVTVSPSKRHHPRQPANGKYNSINSIISPGLPSTQSDHTDTSGADDAFQVGLLEELF